MIYVVLQLAMPLVFAVGVVLMYVFSGGKMEFLLAVYDWVLANAGQINSLVLQTGDLVLKWYVLLVSLAEVLDRFLGKPGLKKALPSPFKK